MEDKGGDSKSRCGGRDGGSLNVCYCVQGQFRWELKRA